MGKMNWFVGQFRNGTLTYLIANTNEKKGTIVAPTGAGKSGIMYADVVKKIKDNVGGEKWIFHFATPINKLGGQTINDFVEPISECFKSLCDNGEFMFFKNNSADGKTYNVEDLNVDVNPFSNIDYFLSSKTAKYAIVISCFDSLRKFADRLDDMNKVATIATYIDEAHLAISTTRDDIEKDKLSKEGQENWNCLELLCDGCEYLYGLTATPDKYVTQIINKSANKEDIDSLLINITPRELLEKNTILPVKTYTDKVSNSKTDVKITAMHCESFMNLVKEDNNKIHHKVLVTCANTDHLRALRDELTRRNNVVFSTCSKDGVQFNGDDEMRDMDDDKFISDIDNYDGDCFVLHIRQLRQGIDIKTLTDCIIYNSTRVNDGVKRILIQTIGRCLRPMAGERGKCIEDRKKKYGNVYLLAGEKDEEAVDRQMQNFLIDYYGTKGIECFTNDISKDYGETGKNKMIKLRKGDDMADDYFANYFEILVEELCANIRKYIKENIKPIYDMHIRLSGGKPNPKLIPVQMGQILRDFATYDTDRNVYDIISHTDLTKRISQLFEEFGLVNKAG